MGPARLAGRIALVTGAASGIGRATALRFAAEGAFVTCADLAGGDATADEIEHVGGSGTGYTVDVTDDGAVGALVEATVGARGGLDIVVNNAGVTILGGVAELTGAAWDRELDVNLGGAFRLSKAAWPHLEARGGGVILNTASIAGTVGIAQDAAYCASKASLIMLTKCMALDGAADRIRVNCICPGYVETAMLEGFFAAQPDPAHARRLARQRTPLGRLGTAADIAAGFAFLASDEAAWITGIALVIDGGVVAGLPPA